MLHSFFFPETVKAFQAVIEADPQCAMGYWGLAASQRPNPLVPPWPDDNLKRALEAIEKGKAVASTARERDWLEAIDTAYKDYDKVPNTTRSQRYEEAMAALAKKYPDDQEAAIFYALALLEAVDHADKTLQASARRRRDPREGRARSSPIIPASRITSSTPTISSRSPSAACRRPTSTPRSPRRHRTRSTCRRTSIRCWDGGRTRSARTRRRSPLARLRGEKLPRHDLCAGAARTGLHGLCLPAARSGPRGKAHRRRARRDPEI